MSALPENLFPDSGVRMFSAHLLILAIYALVGS